MDYESIIKNIYIDPLNTVYIRVNTNTHGDSVQVG